MLILLGKGQPAPILIKLSNEWGWLWGAIRATEVVGALKWAKKEKRRVGAAVIQVELGHLALVLSVLISLDYEFSSLSPKSLILVLSHGIQNHDNTVFVIF
jgi:hypothetical protein